MSINRAFRSWGIWAAFLDSLLIFSLMGYASIASYFGWPTHPPENYSRADFIPFSLIAVSAAVGTATMAIEVFWDFMAFLERHNIGED